jgi:hypothetical protein
VVCISHTKNLFIPENVLLGAIIFGISSLTEKLQRELTKWGEKHDVNKNHLRMLEEVSSFSYFLQKDRFVSRLVKNYNVNYNTIDLLLQKVLNRKNFGKITPKYQKLIEFLQMWKHWDKILRDNSSLEIKLQGFLNELNAPKLYECWLFYKMLASYGEMKQSRKVTIFSNGKYEIQYQWRKTIGWTKVGGTEIPRIPDIMIKKNGTIVAVIDAKYMDGNEELENNVEGGKMPDSKIVNQMIIAMDYGTKKNNVDLGIVMFADKQDSVRIIIEKDGTNKKIYFLNVHPETNPERALEEIKKIIS